MHNEQTSSGFYSRSIGGISLNKIDNLRETKSGCSRRVEARSSQGAKRDILTVNYQTDDSLGHAAAVHQAGVLASVLRGDRMELERVVLQRQRHPVLMVPHDGGVAAVLEQLHAVHPPFQHQYQRILRHTRTIQRHVLSGLDDHLSNHGICKQRRCPSLHPSRRGCYRHENKRKKKKERGKRKLAPFVDSGGICTIRLRQDHFAGSRIKRAPVSRSSLTGRPLRPRPVVRRRSKISTSRSGREKCNKFCNKSRSRF